MYKVFFNEKPLHLTTSLSQKSSEEHPVLFIKYSDAKGIIKALKSKKIKAVSLFHADENKLKMHFQKRFPVVEAAGGLVFHQQGKYLFIFRNKKWDLPKGKINKKEDHISGAIREVYEETNVGDLVVKKPLQITYHLYKANGRYKLKKTHWYLMHTNYSGPLVPQAEESIEKAVWCSTNQIPDLMENAYENIKLIVQEAIYNRTASGTKDE